MQPLSPSHYSPGGSKLHKIPFEPDMDDSEELDELSAMAELRIKEVCQLTNQPHVLHSLLNLSLPANRAWSSSPDAFRAPVESH